MTYDLFLTSNDIVHTVFVIKYWILSKKVNTFWYQTKDRFYTFKLVIITFV